jgi:prepilin-type N-terminal cleavage/methylation domain-containing protein
MHNRKRGGFSLIEVVVVLVLAVILSLIVLALFISRRSAAELDSTAQQIAALLREAQGRSAAGENGISWGVHFENVTNTQPFYALFGNIYGTSTRGGFYTLPLTIGFSTSTLAAGSSTDIVFGKISGLPVVSAKIGVFVLSDPRQSSTINVATSGRVSY